MNWAIGDRTKTRIEGVCKQAFCNAHCVSSSHVDNIVRDIKNGHQNARRTLNDLTKVDMGILQGLRKIAKGFGLHLTKTQVAAAKLPNSPTVLTAYGWMARHFDLIGDMIPNSGGEIHLEPVQIVEVYAEHVLDMTNAGIPYVNVDTFANIWMNCFEHVKIREFKAVSGKCQCCANLSTIRRTFKSERDRQYVTMMHALHRSTYMGERISYAARRNDAIMERSRYMSLISDGMAQGHNVLPYFANQNSWTDSLPQHLQGVLNHNRGMSMYRTFHNINNCANVAMYTFLDTLEKVIQDEGKLPDTVYHQIDGGSENTARAWFALCELIVARRLCKKLVLTRLTVGHTHEDIDSKFGILWRKIRNKFIYTPQQYASKIKKYLSTKKHECEVVDIFAIPDFKTLLDEHVDKEFSAQSKMEKTQLQWTFEAVTPDDYFTHGVRVFYRAYAADEVVQIIEDSSKQCGVWAKAADIFDYPMKDLENGIPVDGMIVLTSLPTTKPNPYPFVQGSRELLDNILLKVRQDFQQCHPKVVDAWTEWSRDVAPASDCVEEYVAKHPLHIPLGDILFSGAPVDRSVVPAWDDKNSITDNLQRMRTTDCVKWRRWGFKREDHCPENFARVEFAANNPQLLVNALPEKVQYFRQWKKRKNVARDEKGDFTFVLCREDRKNIRTPFATEGQLIELSSGGHRIYWKNKRKPEDFLTDDEDKTFPALLDIGWFSYGRIEPPSDGRGKVGIVVLTDANGLPIPHDARINENTAAPAIVERVEEPAEEGRVEEPEEEERVEARVEEEPEEEKRVEEPEEEESLDETEEESVEEPVEEREEEEREEEPVEEEPVEEEREEKEERVEERVEEEPEEEEERFKVMKRKYDSQWYSTSSVDSCNVVAGKRCRQRSSKCLY